MRQNQQSQPFHPLTDQDLDLQRRGQAWDLSIEDRELAIAGLRVLGLDVAADRIRDFNESRRRAALKVAPPPAPRPGPRPRQTPATPPILFAIEGGGDPLAGVIEDDLVVAELGAMLAALAARPVSDELRDDLVAALADLGRPVGPPLRGA